jgi:hypothetical protein
VPAKHHADEPVTSEVLGRKGFFSIGSSFSERARAAELTEPNSCKSMRVGTGTTEILLKALQSTRSLIGPQTVGIEFQIPLPILNGAWVLEHSLVHDSAIEEG